MRPSIADLHLTNDRRFAIAVRPALRGIIPICAHRKYERTGPGEWRKIEPYLREPNAAGFSHGLCPGCAGDYFPGAGGGAGRSRTSCA